MTFARLAGTLEGEHMNDAGSVALRRRLVGVIFACQGNNGDRGAGTKTEATEGVERHWWLCVLSRDGVTWGKEGVGELVVNLRRGRI